MKTSTLIASALCGIAATALLSSALSPAPAPQDGPEIPGLTSWVLVDLTLPEGLPANWSAQIPYGGGMLDMSLASHSVRSQDFTALVDVGGNQLVEVDAPPSRTYRGACAGHGDSRVAGSLLESGFSGVILLDPETTLVVQPISDFLPALAGIDSRHVVFNAADAIAPEGFCGNLLHNMNVKRLPGQEHGEADEAGAAGESEGGIAGTTPSICDISCDSDYEFFTDNGSSVNNSIADIELIINGIDAVYDRDVNIIFEITTTVIRSTSDDPYTTTTIDGRLGELDSVWSAAPYNSVPDDVVHLFSGYNFSGGTIGLAYLGVVCYTPSFFGVVESKYTTSLNYRLSLSAHELGHNWDATHCDSQGNAACHIMCSANGACGGISGANLKFDALSISEITAYRNSAACDATAAAPAPPPFTENWDTTAVSTARWSYNKGGSVTTTAPGEPSPTYSINLDSTGSADFGDDELRSVRINMSGLTGHELRYWVNRIGVEAGETLTVQYINSSMHWLTINTITSDGTNPAAFTEYVHTLPALAHHADARIRFVTAGDDTGDDWFIDNISVAAPGGPTPPPNDYCANAINVSLGSTGFDTAGATLDLIAIPTQCNETAPGFVNDIWYTFTGVCDGVARVSTCGTTDFDTKILLYQVSACPNSATPLLACDDNTGSCALGTTEIDFPMSAGANYYIRLGGTVTTGAGILNLSLVSCGTPCPADLTGDGTVNGADLGALLAGWGAASGDVDGNGTTDGADLGAMLGAFGDCQ